MTYSRDHVLSLLRLYADQAAKHGSEIAMEVVLERHDQERTRAERPRAAAVPCALTDDIIARVAQRHGVTISMLKGKSKTATAVAARHEAMWRVGKALRMAKETGRRLGGFDHSTVLHAWRVFEERNPDVVASEGRIDLGGEARAA